MDNLWPLLRTNKPQTELGNRRNLDSSTIAYLANETVYTSNSRNNVTFLNLWSWPLDRFPCKLECTYRSKMVTTATDTNRSVMVNNTFYGDFWNAWWRWNVPAGRLRTMASWVAHRQGEALWKPYQFAFHCLAWSHLHGYPFSWTVAIFLWLFYWPTVGAFVPEEIRR